VFKRHFQQYFSYIMAISFSGGGSRKPIRRGFAPGFVNYKKGCTRLTAASDKVYELLAHGRWFSPASSTTKNGHHEITTMILLISKVALRIMG
jgi:hypothetical protein